MVRSKFSGLSTQVRLIASTPTILLLTAAHVAEYIQATAHYRFDFEHELQHSVDGLTRSRSSISRVHADGSRAPVPHRDLPVGPGGRGTRRQPAQRRRRRRPRHG
jgi:hypothetical protein